MKICIISTNHKLPSWIEQGINDFVKRFANWNLNLIELKPSTKTSLEERKLIEAKNIEKHIPAKYKLIILDESGKNNTTQELAHNMSNWQHQYSGLCFIIGGADGIYFGLKNQADYILCLSSMTLPHGFAKLLLIEQIYRVWSILNNHPYHRI